MKSKIIKIVVVVLVAIMSLVTLSGCSIQLTPEEAVRQLGVAVQNSLKSEYKEDTIRDIFYWKELILDPNKTGDISESITTNVNVHVDADNKGILLYDGEYVNYAARVESKTNSIITTEILVGDSTSKEDGNVVIPHIVRKSFNEKGKHISSTKEEMTIDEYMSSEEFQQYTVQSKLFELSLLKLEHFDFSYEKSEHYSKGVVTVIKAAITQEFVDDFYDDYGYESMFKCEYVEIEMAFDRISKIGIYQKEIIEGFENVYESYKFEIVYLGKNIYVPSFDDEGMKYV